MPLSPRNLLKLKDELVLTLAMGLALVIQFVFQSVAARSLTADEYGQINSLLAIQGILNIPIAVWQLAQARSLSSYHGSAPGFRKFAVRQLWQIRHAVLIVFGLYLLLGPLIRVYVGGTSWHVWILVVLGCLLSVIESWGLACLQSRYAFLWLGLISIGAALVRLTSIMILLPHLDGAAAIMTAVLGGFMVPIVGIILFFRVAVSIPEKETAVLELSMVPASLSAVFAILWLNIDFIVARNRFDPVMAGEYAAVAVLCKAVFWFANPIATIYLPRYVKALAEGPQKALQTLRRAVYLCLIISVAAILVGWTLSGWLLKLFAGERADAETVHWLRLAIVAKLPIICLTPLLTYFVAKDSKRVLVVLLSLLILMFLYAQTFAYDVQVLLAILFVSGMMMFIFAVICVRLTVNTTDLHFSWERSADRSDLS